MDGHLLFITSAGLRLGGALLIGFFVMGAVGAIYDSLTNRGLFSKLINTKGMGWSAVLLSLVFGLAAFGLRDMLIEAYNYAYH